MTEQIDRAMASIKRAYDACGPERHCPFGDPQKIADFNEAERKRIAKTPYGKHTARIAAFNADPSTDNLSDNEFDELLNKTGKESYQQYLKEIA